MVVTYRSDRQIAEAYLPIALLHTVVHDGADLSEPFNQQVLGWLTEAGIAALDGVASERRVKLMRRAGRIHNALIEPFRKAEASLAKVGLTVYYVLEQLRDCGYFVVEDGTPLDQAVNAMLAEDGTLTQLANIPAADQSAQKQARKLFDAIKAEGLYREATWQ